MIVFWTFYSGHNTCIIVQVSSLRTTTMANLAPADGYGSSVAGVRHVAPPSGIPSASAFPPVHAAASNYQPFAESFQQAAGLIMPAQYMSAQPGMQSPPSVQPQAQQSANGTAAPGPQQQAAMQVPAQQQPYHQHYQQQMQHQQHYTHQLQPQQQLQQQHQLHGPVPQHIQQQQQQALQSAMGVPAPATMNGYTVMPRLPPQQAGAQRLPYAGQPGGYTVMRPTRGVGRPLIPMPPALQQQQPQPQPHAVAPATPRPATVPFKLITPSSNVRVTPATIRAMPVVSGPRPAGAGRGESAAASAAGVASPRPAAGSPCRPGVMGIPAASRGAPQRGRGQVLAPGVPQTGVPAPGAPAPGRPPMRPPSQPHVIVNGVSDK